MSDIATWEETDVDAGQQYESIATEPQSQVDRAWEPCIDALLKTLSNPVDDGLVAPPNHAAIVAALGWVQWLRKQHPSAPPTLITREPSGGIIIARRDRAPNGIDCLSELTIYNDLTAETTRYVNGRVVEMSPIPPQPPRVGLRD